MLHSILHKGKHGTGRSHQVVKAMYYKLRNTAAHVLTQNIEWTQIDKLSEVCSIINTDQHNFNAIVEQWKNDAEWN